MAHVRQQIRKEFLMTLTGLGLTGSRVFSTRVYPLARDPDPTLSITTPTDNTTSALGVLDGFKEFKRLTVNVQAVVKATTDYEDILDDVCAEVSAAIFANDRLNGKGDVDELTSTVMSFTGEGDQPLGVATMTFIVIYRVDELDPTVVLN